MKDYIEININNNEDIFNKFNKEQISNELANYILTSSKKFLTSSNIKIVIFQKVEMGKEEQNKVVHAIKEHFSLLASEKTKNLKLNNDKTFVLLGIGLSLIVLSDFCSKIINVLIPELFLIVGWIAIWEMINSIFVSNNENKLERTIAKKISECEIEFK